MLQLQFIILPAVTALMVVVTLILVGLAVRAVRSPSYWSVDYGDSGWGIASVFTGGISIVLVIVSLVLFIPYQGKYLTIEHPSGTIATTSYRQGGVVVDGESGTVYVLTLKGNPAQYIVNDDRATKFKVGDRINLACTLQWNYGAKDQWNCSLGDGR